MLAAAGARIVGSVGAKTALLVVAGGRPFADGMERSSAYRRAEALIGMGQPLRIISASDACNLIAEAAELVTAWDQPGVASSSRSSRLNRTCSLGTCGTAR